MPILIKRLLLTIRSHIDQLSWQAVVLAILAHMGITWLLLAAAGEQALLAPNTFFYYYVVTTSTVGYGDLSPSSDLGRLLVALVQIPFGLALFGMLLGKAGQTITHIIRRAMTGEKDVTHFANHIIIFGWHPVRTRKMVRYILADDKRVRRDIVLAVTDDIEHPFFSEPNVSFVKLSSYTDEEQLKRVGISTADRIIVEGADDNQSFTTALKISKLVKERAHICAYFDDESKAQMLSEHCANVECSSNRTAEVLVRSMEDPGASRVQQEIMSSLHGDTHFSMVIPNEVSRFTYADIFELFKRQYDATILGIAHNRSALDMDLNPPLDYAIQGGDIIHYIAPVRVLAAEVKWP
ncbi:potassium channel family protein [Pseudoalteromonas sp. T1lg76]|uniref:potassium channel family protein n=1 Tax=Pseudoalteromonas sp. T1lg76 TaxID=2077103 RepID=UPI000CF656DF|nr:potassium channel family protein [Pseudoalteromonas sp. T1lg76]